jgi:hypothetical protein
MHFPHYDRISVKKEQFTVTYTMIMRQYFKVPKGSFCLCLFKIQITGYD